VRLVRTALDLGVRFFDTADSYGAGTSEAVLGRALGSRRDQVFLATKAGYTFRERSPAERAARSAAFRVAKHVGAETRRVNQGRGIATSLREAGPARPRQDFSPGYLRRALEGSLRRLRTDYVDLFQLHAPPGVCGEDTLELVAELRRAGMIREFGIGFEVLDDVLPWLRTRAVSRVQVPFGVLDAQAADHAIPAARRAAVPVIARGVFAAGLLAMGEPTPEGQLSMRQREVRMRAEELASDAGVEILQVAAWFVRVFDGVDVALIGTSSPAHLQQSFEYVGSLPPPDLVPRLRALTTSRHSGDNSDDGTERDH
jgi:aryl-alcohol dehydrogenase-like predicted oxidoreductase